MKKTNGSTKLVLGTVIAAGLAAGSMGASALVAPVEGTVVVQREAAETDPASLSAAETQARALYVMNGGPGTGDGGSTSSDISTTPTSPAAPVVTSTVCVIFLSSGKWKKPRVRVEHQEE